MKKMNYEEFKQYVLNHFLEFLPKPYADWHISVQSIAKVNRMEEALMVREGKDYDDRPRKKVYPVVHFSRMYTDYLKADNVEEVIQSHALWLKIQLETDDEDSEILYEVNKVINKPENRVHIRLVNRELNQELLSLVPHRPFLDVEMIYYLRIGNGRSAGDALIKSEQMKKWGITEPKLYEIAKKNMQRINEPFVKPITQVIMESLNSDIFGELSEEERDKVVDVLLPSGKKKPIWVVSNQKKNQGAAVVLCEGLLSRFAETADDDLYILPSSIHEMIAVRCSDVDLTDVKDMQYEITHADDAYPNEYLSDQVYMYIRNEDRLIIV